MTWKNRRVLVTGGAGFIGSNLCHALVRRGATVTIVDDFSVTGGACLVNLEGAPVNLIRHDVYQAEPYWLENTDVIFNLAAQTSHVDAQEFPFGDLRINASAQVRLIAAVRAHCPDAVVVHTSTRQIYGRPDYLPVDETHPIRPPDNNAISKFAGEQYWLLEARLHERRVSVLRLTNVYGPRMRIRDARQNFFGLWIRRALQGEPIEVWGGDQLRDMAYVDDVVEALIAAAETEACWGQALNVGGTSAWTLRQIAEMMVGPRRFVVKPFPHERAGIDIGSFVSDDKIFRGITDWKRQVDIREGIMLTMEWFRPRMEAYA